jgi:hypothetical protein
MKSSTATARVERAKKDLELSRLEMESAVGALESTLTGETVMASHKLSAVLQKVKMAKRHLDDLQVRSVTA